MHAQVRLHFLEELKSKEKGDKGMLENREIYYEKDCNLGLIKDKKIVVVGYGSQGTCRPAFERARRGLAEHRLSPGWSGSGHGQPGWHADPVGYGNMGTDPQHAV